MTMENQVTSIEQSKRLLELGVPTEKASMCWSEIGGERRLIMKVPGPYVVPAFTAVDLFDIIGEPEGYAFYVTKWDEDYAVELAGDKPLFFRNKRLIDSAFQMVERLYEEGSGLPASAR